MNFAVECHQRALSAVHASPAGGTAITIGGGYLSRIIVSPVKRPGITKITHLKPIRMLCMQCTPACGTPASSMYYTVCDSQHCAAAVPCSEIVPVYLVLRNISHHRAGVQLSCLLGWLFGYAQLAQDLPGLQCRSAGQPGHGRMIPSPDVTLHALIG
jgi:hypothetical protein